MNIAVIGLGKMGLLHACILNTLPGVKISAICEKQPVVRLFARKILPGIRIVNNISALKKMQLNAVYVTTSSASHYAVIKDIYEQMLTKNIFVEKPLCVSYAQAIELCAVADKGGVINMVGYNKKFCPTFKKALALLKSGEMGKISYISATAYSSDFYGQHRFVPQSYTRGGALRDIGCHLVDLLQWLAGDFQVDRSELEVRVSQNRYYVDDAKAQLIFENGVRGDLHVSWCRENYRLPQMDINIKGSDGELNVNEYQLKVGKGRNTVIYRKHELEQGVPYFQGDTDYYHEDHRFIEAVMQGRGAENSFVSAANVDRMLDEIVMKGQA